MSYVSVEDVKVALVISLDDERIQMAIDDAEDEALMYLNFTGANLAEAIDAELQNTATYPGGDDGNFGSVRRAVILLCQCYVDDVTPADADMKRKAAERLMFPYRKGLGV